MNFALLQRILNKADAEGFDPAFYKSYYKDLSELHGSRRLRMHYARFGKSEGRFPNRTIADQEISKLYARHESFDIRAYKHFNPELKGNFETNDQFILHYDRHGKLEGRRCAFDGELLSESVEDQTKITMWEAVFSAPEAIAWFGDVLPVAPTTKNAAIDAFRESGIDRLWPIQLSFMFDADFYRSVIYTPDSEEIDDADLYRHWLEVGLPAGFAPNANAYLYIFLGGAAFPDGFDWEGYSLLLPKSKCNNRYEIFKTIFESKYLDYSSLKFYFEDNYSNILVLIGKYALANGLNDKAEAAFISALSISPSSTVYCLLGDVYRKKGQKKEAVGAYRESIALENAPIWSYFNYIDILFSQQDYIGGLKIFSLAYKNWGHKFEFSQKFDECIGILFEHESARAHRIFKECGPTDGDKAIRVAGDQIINLTLDRIRSLFLACDNLPAKVGASGDGPVLLLANDDLRQCTYYRIDQKILQFGAAGIPIKFFSHRDTDKFLNNLPGARAAIFYRVAAVPNILRAIVHAKAMGLPTYYEVDDLIFDSACYPDPYDTFEGQISEEEYSGLQFGVPLFRYAMSQCDQIIASTPALADQMRRVANTPAGLVVHNGLDSRNAIAVHIGERRPMRTDGMIRIFYGSGTKAHNADFNELVGPALVEVMSRYAFVELVIVGHLKLRPELQSFGERVRTFPFTASLNAYWSLLSGCDINLAVLHSGIVADCKSEIKWLEAAVLEVPSIVTATATYREVVENGVDGLLVFDSDDWLRHLNLLVTDAHARQRIGESARKKVLQDYSVERAASIWKAAFDPKDAANPHSVAAKHKIRVMVCNVFFHPQSIGGATRVVEDNIRTLLELHNDVEFAVFCSNEGDPNLGRLRVGHFQQVPVYRIATPMEEGMDWRPFNAANKAAFEQALDAFQPDIIHFHCIQRLTASIVEVALARSIPYIVTLHDGWWISDNQFLIDADGFLQLPTTDLIADCERSKNPMHSIERRQRLRALLHSAHARLSVSGPFAQIYAAAGIEGITVIENGIPVLAPSPRQPRIDGRVALGHIGGRAAHKGAFLIEAALRQGNYQNLHLTMIDGTMAMGETMHTTWGTTPVSLCGPYPQSKIADLYAQLDVLLAPSTWPESYGLVTREALSLGLWVVASNLGAIGQGITEGLNGHLIDTSTAKDLKSAFKLIEADPLKYCIPPTNVMTKARYMADQAKDLHDLYKSMSATGKKTL